MADTKKDGPSRRKFISVGLLTWAGWITGKTNAQPNTESGERIKMLTQDGKIVEVDKHILSGNAQKRPASKRDILKWMNRNG